MTYCPIVEVGLILWKGWWCVKFSYMGAYCSIISNFSYGVRTYSRLGWTSFFSFSNKTLSPMRYTLDCLRQYSFWLPLFIGACIHCLINCQLASWLILRIASLASTYCNGICYVVVCILNCMANIVKERSPFQGFSSCKSIYNILNVRIILPIVWYALSTIALACRFLVLMGLHSIP